MALLILFGLPGAGKTFVGEVIKKSYGYYVQEGDDDLPAEMERRIHQSRPISDDLRDIFFDRLITHTKNLTEKYQNLVVTQTFIKEKYRIRMLETLPQTQFILIQTDTRLREQRLIQRTSAPLDIAYARKMNDYFETPLINHHTITNNENGENQLREQLESFFNSQKSQKIRLFM